LVLNQTNIRLIFIIILLVLLLLGLYPSRKDKKLGVQKTPSNKNLWVQKTHKIEIYKIELSTDILKK